MLGGAMYTTIETLMKKGMNKSQIAQATGHDWKTVSKVLKRIQKGLGAPYKKDHPLLLDDYKQEVLQWIEQGLTAMRIYEKLQENGVKIGYSTVRRYCKNLRSNQKIFVRIHTQPGEEAQVDFGYVGLIGPKKGKKRKAWVFNMRLSYSRLDYYEVVHDQRVETFIQCHINAFKYFNGVPKTVKIDNLKAAVLEANFYEPVYQQMYKKFADHYGFYSIACRVRMPNDKGKVESGIKYVKRNFFAGRSFENLLEVNMRLHRWFKIRANRRIHGTTRKVPEEVFEKEEADKLSPLPLNEFNLLKVGTRKVYHDCHIYVEYNYYSVPFSYVGKQVDIMMGEDLVKVYYQGEQIAVHKRLRSRGEFSTHNGHYPRYRMQSETEYQEQYQVRMSKIGRYAEQLFFYVKEKRPYDWNRTISGILHLQKTYSAEVVNQACQRALAFGAIQYKIVRNICASGSYALPLEYQNEEFCYEHH